MACQNCSPIKCAVPVLISVTLAVFAATWGPLGSAASLTIVYKKKAIKAAKPDAYDLASTEALQQHHCAFAAWLNMMGILESTLQQVCTMRHCLAASWLKQPHLQQVAASMGLKPHQYVAALQDNLWGGVPEFELLATQASTSRSSMAQGKRSGIQARVVMNVAPCVGNTTTTHWFAKYHVECRHRSRGY